MPIQSAAMLSTDQVRPSGGVGAMSSLMSEGSGENMFAPRFGGCAYPRAALGLTVFKAPDYVKPLAHQGFFGPGLDGLCDAHRALIAPITLNLCSAAMRCIGLGHGWVRWRAGLNARWCRKSAQG